MPAAWPWFERKFDFSFPPEKSPDILERLRGTPLRLQERVRGLSTDVCVRRDGDSWSIQENVGHIADVEPLWLGRIDDILAGTETMRAADLTNAKTHQAGHNDRSMADLLASVGDVRTALMDRLNSLTVEQMGSGALHPRLQVPMRLVDLCHFVAEHDDYHLARITHLRRKFGA